MLNSTAQMRYTCICPRQYANSCFNKADGSSKPKKRGKVSPRVLWELQMKKLTMFM